MQCLAGPHTRVLQVSLAVLFLGYVTYKNKDKVSSNGWVGWLFFINRITLAECYHHPINVVIISSLMHLLANPDTNKAEQVILSALVAVMQPAYCSVLALRKIVIIGQNSDRKYFEWVQMGLWVAVSLFSVFTLNYDEYFGTEFEKSSGVTWLLYSHQFQNYLLLYQTILTLSPYIILLPLCFLLSPNLSKLTILYFICTFTSSHLTLIHIWALYFLEWLAYGQIMRRANKRQQLIWNTLTLMLGVITIPTYFFYERLIWIWHNTHMISVGYFLLQILLFWGVHSVYLSEMLIILDPPQEQDDRKLVHRLIDYFKTRIEQM